jgi:hypothetical protein
VVAAGFLLDTNVVSELMKPGPNAGVVEWIEATDETLLHLSVITLGETRKGIDLLAEDDPKRGPLQSWLDHDLRVRFAGRWLAFDHPVAERWGQLEALVKKRRVMVSTIDGAASRPDVRHPQRSRHPPDRYAPDQSLARGVTGWHRSTCR